ncbi:MAG: Ku protein [Luteolibacter sp.]|uniref:non-homologous end joining protein Ku n=1 Tax=Luteolibacter sp. TaxID=1962973 RepID=UPI003264B5F4
MARSIWKGAIAFGLVNIPVSLTSAEARPDIQFHMVDSKNHARIRYERVNSDTGEEVPWDRMVKGYEHDDGQFILLTEEDLEAVQPRLTKTIEISEFVSLDEIDPLLFDKPYYLEPEKRGRKAYALLREALRQSGKAGISRVVIRTREYLSAMFVREDVLVLMLLRFPQEIRASSKLELPSSADKEWQPVKKEMDLAGRLIDEMTGKWKPSDFHDEYRDALMDFIEKKIAGGETVDDVKQPGDEDEAGDKVLDLAEYLQRSFKKPTAAKTATRSKPTPKARKATKKNASKKVATKKGRRSA